MLVLLEQAERNEFSWLSHFGVTHVLGCGASVRFKAFSTLQKPCSFHDFAWGNHQMLLK
jgi:hypothetical protein